MESYIQSLAAIVAILVGAAALAKYFWKHTVYKKGNFQIGFINHFPLPQFTEDPIEDPPDSIKLIPPGTHKLLLRVFALHGFQVKKINLRCLNPDLTNASNINVTITDAIDPYYPRLASATPDGNGGVDGEYSEVRSLAKGEGLYFEITLNAIQNWSGYLSFRAQDPNGFRSWVRHSVEIREGAAPPVYMPYVPPATPVSPVPTMLPQTVTSNLRLEFREGNTQFLHREPHHVHLSAGTKYSGLIAVHNDSVNPSDQVRIVIDGIFPSRFGTRNFAVKCDAPDGIVISIAPRDRQFIALFEFFDAPPFHNECLLHVACEVANPGTGEEFLMKVRVTGRTVSEPARIMLRFGFRDDEFFMRQA